MKYNSNSSFSKRSNPTPRPKVQDCFQRDLLPGEAKNVADAYPAEEGYVRMVAGSVFLVAKNYYKQNTDILGNRSQPAAGVFLCERFLYRLRSEVGDDTYRNRAATPTATTMY